MSKKKRIEIRIDTVKDHDVIEFLENNVDNQAGFIKMLLRQYVRGDLVLNPHSPTPKEEKTVSSDEKPVKTKNERKMLPKSALNGFSSKEIK